MTEQTHSPLRLQHCTEALMLPDPLFPRRYVKKHKLEAATVTEKQCTKCLIVKPAGQFHAQRNVSTGLHSWCKTCVAAEYARNPRVRCHTQPS